MANTTPGPGLSTLHGKVEELCDKFEQLSDKFEQLRTANSFQQQTGQTSELLSTPAGPWSDSNSVRKMKASLVIKPMVMSEKISMESIRKIVVNNKIPVTKVRVSSKGSLSFYKNKRQT